MSDRRYYELSGRSGDEAIVRFILPDDISFNKHRRIELYWESLYGLFVTWVYQTVVEKAIAGGETLSEDGAAEVANEAIAEYATDAEICRQFQVTFRSRIAPILRTIDPELTGLKLDPIPLYRFLIHDPERKKPGLLWLMEIEVSPSLEQERERLGEGEDDGEPPLETGDPLLDLESGLRFAFAEGGCDPSLFDRYGVSNLNKIRSLAALRAERISRKYDLDRDKDKKMPIVPFTSAEKLPDVEVDPDFDASVSIDAIREAGIPLPDGF